MLTPEARALDAELVREGAERASAFHRARLAQREVPSSNRGLKSSDDQATGTHNEAALAIVDYLTFTASLAVLMGDMGDFGARVRAAAAEGCATSIELLCRYVLRAISAESLSVDANVRGFLNFYEHHVVLRNSAGKVAGFFMMGGERQRGTFCLELKGEGCAHVGAWAQTSMVLEGWGARLTRVDCAHDDREGRYTLADVQRWYDEGAFTSRGRPPAIGYGGYADGSGQTIYVGKNKGNQQLCVYEKGKQLGDPDSPWVRFEARFGAKYRDIPYDILERPWEYITGHYPSLSWISELTTRMQTATAKLAANMVSGFKHARRQSGRWLFGLREAFPEVADFAAAVGALLMGQQLPTCVESHPLGAAILAPVLQPDIKRLIAI